MPVPTLSQQGAIAAVTTGNLAITLPTYAADDIVVITTVGWVPNTTTGTNTQSLASPWTKYTPAVTSGNPIDTEHAFWWARATSASSLGTTVTITRPTGWDTGTDTCWAGRAYVINGCVTTGNPYDELAATALSTAANPQLPAITVSGGNRLALIFMTKADNSATPTAATGYTVGTEVTTNTGTDAAFQTYRQTTSANITAVTPTGGAAPAQGNSVYFEVAFVPAPVTATAAAPLGSVSGSGTAVVTRSATAASSLGSVTGLATGTITPTVTATATAPLGAVTSTASATITHLAVGNAALGSLTASSTAAVTLTATASSSLGSIAANAAGTVTHIASGITSVSATATASANTAVTVSGSAQLGSLLAEASSTPEVDVQATSTFGALSAQATAVIASSNTALAELGSLQGAAIATVESVNAGFAPLGELAATATATVTPVAKPAGGGGVRWIQPQQRPPLPQIKQPEPQHEPVKVRPVIKPAPKLIRLVSASAISDAGELSALAVSRIDWIAELDDIEVLELI